MRMNEGIVVPYGTQFCNDTVPYEGTWHYFVAASDNQQKYDIIIPFSNTIDINVGTTIGNTVVPPVVTPLLRNTVGWDNYAPVFYSFPGTQLRPEPYQEIYPYRGMVSQGDEYAFEDNAVAAAPTYPQASAPAPAASPPPAYPPVPVRTPNPDLTHTVTGIRANVVRNGIEISFMDGSPGKNAVLYRNTQPLRGLSDLLIATVAALNIRSPYIDTPEPGTPYFYAIIYEDDIRNGRGELYPGSNSTLTPVEIPLNQRDNAASQTSRQWTSDEQVYGGGLITAAPLAGRQTRTVPESSYQGYGYSQRSDTGKTSIVREPRVFNRDLQNASDPAERRLGAIIQGPFTWRDWQTARSDLSAYLAGNPPASVAVRARFYLAQSHYFIGDTRSALSEFLKLQQTYPDEVPTWIQACLDKIVD